MRLCIETGGTTIRLAITDPKAAQQKLEDIHKIPNTTFEQVESDILAYAQKYPGIAELGIISFGPIMLDKKSPDFGKLLTAPCEAKASWLNKSLAKEIGQKLGVGMENIHLTTDCTGSAMGELYFGTHPNKSGTLVYITIGTGVGIGAVVDGQPIRGRLHPEGGHVLIQKDDREAQFPHFKGPCSKHRSCVENMITNYAIAERYKLNIDELHTLSDDEPIWDMVGNYLAQLCLSITYILSPHNIVVGGGILNRKSILPAARKYFAAYNNDYVQLCDLENYITESQVGENGLFGCAVLK